MVDGLSCRFTLLTSFTKDGAFVVTQVKSGKDYGLIRADWHGIKGKIVGLMMGLLAVHGLLVRYRRLKAIDIYI